jgi:antitoxin (DNA-binding transcriptional repressor) of toxin-antitoxin stability system
MYNRSMSKRVIHISEAEAAGNLAAVLDRVSAGTEIVIERDSHPVAVVRAPQQSARLLSESIALAEAHAKESGNDPVMDRDFANDLKSIIESRKPRDLDLSKGE